MRYSSEVQATLSGAVGQRRDATLVPVAATVEALKMLEQPETVASRRGLPVEQVAPAALLKAAHDGAATAEEVTP